MPRRAITTTRRSHASACTRWVPHRSGRGWVGVILGGLALLLSAGASAAEPPEGGSASEPTVEPSPAPSETPQPSEDEGARPVPQGFSEMVVFTVAPTEMGNVVILADQYGTTMVPIWIGETEALAIALRLEGEGFQRPLTHDLVDAILRELGGRVVEVRIDSLQANTFVASIFIRQGDREILLDSRASDSIALALGNGVPIFVSDRVIRETGIRPTDLGFPPFQGGAAPSRAEPTEEDIDL